MHGLLDSPAVFNALKRCLGDQRQPLLIPELPLRFGLTPVPEAAELVHLALWLFWTITPLLLPPAGVLINLAVATAFNLPCLWVQRLQGGDHYAGLWPGVRGAAITQVGDGDQAADHRQRAGRIQGQQGGRPRFGAARSTWWPPTGPRPRLSRDKLVCRFGQILQPAIGSIRQGSRLPGRIATLNSVDLPAISGLLAMPWNPASP